MKELVDMTPEELADVIFSAYKIIYGEFLPKDRPFHLATMIDKNGIPFVGVEE